MNHRWKEGATYSNLGTTHHSLGDFKKAIHYHQRYLKIAKELGDRWGEQVAYCNLGHAHYCLGDFKTTGTVCAHW